MINPNVGRERLSPPPLTLPPQVDLVNQGQIPALPQPHLYAPVNALTILQQGNRPLPALAIAIQGIGLHYFKSRFGG